MPMWLRQSAEVQTNSQRNDDLSDLKRGVVLSARQADMSIFKICSFTGTFSHNHLSGLQKAGCKRGRKKNVSSLGCVDARRQTN